MVALGAPTPIAFRRRRAEHREEVATRIASHSLSLLSGILRLPFEIAKQRLEIHDGRGREVSALAQPGLQQRVGQLPLSFVHLVDRQAVSGERLSRDEVPVSAFVGIERKYSLLALLSREAVQKSC